MGETRENQPQSQNVYNNGPLMTRIDGGRVRQIREQKGLTQLYLATVVGVTTDTISRWENRRYPTIKKENALKLAEALEVEYVEILERPDEIEEEDQERDAEPRMNEISEKGRHSAWWKAGVIAPVLLVVALFFFLYLHKDKTTEPAPNIHAYRAIPGHTPPGIPFPVLIHITASAHESLALIVKENLPEGCAFIKGVPPFTALDNHAGEAKWIQKIDGGQLTLLYMAQTDPSFQGEVQLKGTVTVRIDTQLNVKVGGRDSVAIETFHWADADKDNIIDDDEILMVYDTYNNIKGLDFGMDQIEEIWSSSGYVWDEKKKRFVMKAKE